MWTPTTPVTSSPHVHRAATGLDVCHGCVALSISVRLLMQPRAGLADHFHGEVAACWCCCGRMNWRLTMPRWCRAGTRRSPRRGAEQPDTLIACANFARSARESPLMPLMARGDQQETSETATERDMVTDLGFRGAGDGAGDRNRTRTISLGSRPVTAVRAAELRIRLPASDRDCLSLTGLMTHDDPVLAW
jgi:hypothetical protein